MGRHASRTHVYSDYSAAWRNVDGVRTIGVSFFGTDRCLSGCALFIIGLYVLPYKDGIYRAGFGAFCSAAVAGFGAFGAAVRARTRRPSSRAEQCRHCRQHACLHVCAYVYMRICIHAYMHVCMCACMHICMYALVVVWSCACAYVYVCMRACMHVCM